MKKTVLIFVSAICLFSCSNPLDKKFSKETLSDDLVEIGKSGSLDTSDSKILAGMAIATAFNATSDLEGKTYREIINKYKKEEAEKQILAEKARKEEGERIALLNESLTVALFDKGFYKEDYQQYISYKFAFENKTEKSIRAFKGEIVFTNLFGDEIKTMPLTFDKPIKAKEIYKWNASSEYNQFIDSDKVLANKELKDLKVIWKPVKIIFEDGSSIE